MDTPSVMPFGDHLEELRKRLVLGLAGLIPILVLCLVFGGPLLKFLMIPLLESLRAAGEPTQLLATSPLETFGAYVKVATIVSILVTTPWLVYQLWLFVAPGLYERERRFVYFLIPLSAALTASGMAFLYKVMLPISLYFLIIFGTRLVQTSPPMAPLEPGVTLGSIPVLAGDPPLPGLTVGDAWINEPLGELRVLTAPGKVSGFRMTGQGAISQQYRIGDYVGLVFTLGLVFAISFQLPLALLLTSWVGILEAKDVARYRRHAVMACAVAGAVLTPQDPGSMIVLGAALYFLFELGIILMRFVPARVVGEGFRKRGGTDGGEGDA